MKNIDYGKIIKRSWEITWKTKWLWVVGLVLAAFSGGTGSGLQSPGSGSSTSNSIVPNPSPDPNMYTVPKTDGITNVLGAATDAIGNWFMSVPVQNWVLIGFGVVLLILFFVAIRWVMVSWANGALILGFEDADNGREVNLKTMSPQGLLKIKDLIVLGLISTGLILLFGLSFLVIMGLGFLVKIASPTLGSVWLVLFGIVGFLVLIVFIVIVSMMGVYSDRLIVLKNYKPWDAWKKGFSLTKGNFLATVVMGIINSTIGCVSGCAGTLVLLLLFAIPGYLLISPLFVGGFHWPGVGQVIGIFVLLLLFGSISLLIRAVLTVFNCGNWNQFFKQIVENENITV
jgi:hypothetical protein